MLTRAIAGLWVALCVVQSGFVLCPAQVCAAAFVDEERNYRVDYPDDWHVHSGLLQAGAPLTLQSCPPTARQQGGTLPPGCAEVTVQVFPADKAPTEVIDGLFKEGDAVQSQQVVAGRSVERLDFTYENAPAARSKRTAMSFRSGSQVYLVMLTYPLQGAAPDRWDQALSRIISSLREGK